MSNFLSVVRQGTSDWSMTQLSMPLTAAVRSCVSRMRTVRSDLFD